MKKKIKALSVSNYLRDTGIKQILKLRGYNIHSAIRHLRTRCKIPKGKNLSHTVTLFRNVLENKDDVFPEEQQVINLLNREFENSEV